MKTLGRQFPPFLLATMDPGGDTGLALLHITPEDFLLRDWEVVGYRPPKETPLRILKRWRMEELNVPWVIIYEDFHVRSSGRVPNTTALEVIGELSAWMREEPPSGMQRTKWPFDHVIKQEPNQGKPNKGQKTGGLVTNEILERLDLKVKGRGSRHVHDALRHAVTWLVLQRYIPLCRRAWPC